MLRLVAVVCCLFLLFVAVAPQALKFQVPNAVQENDHQYWYNLGQDDIDFAISRKIINKDAKNVILFLGDGLGVTVNTAARIFKGQKNGVSGEEGYLVWDRLPNTALLKTYNVDKQVPDSAASATAYLTGVKGPYFTSGLSGGGIFGDCPSSLKPENRPPSVVEWMDKAGKDTGFVTTTRVTHASPAALYAHSADRYWECDQTLKQAKDNEGCKDIGRQLLEDYPGTAFKVILGGGRRMMGAALPTDGGSTCLRNDSRNLVEEWLEQKRTQGNTAAYVTTSQQLRDINVNEVDYVMGLFGGSHTPYEFERDTSPEGTPSLKEMTETAIKRLSRNPNGFFLFVEGGRIDHGLHDTRTHTTMEEVVAMNDAVEAALRLVDVEETLVIVTADHSHVMTMNGYPERGNDILGVTTHEDITDGLPYTTLMFTTGNATNYTYDGEKVVRSNLTGIDTRDHYFQNLAAVPVKHGYETHGGEDVALFAVGPMSHLFHRVHEQTYIAHVMSRAACAGPFKGGCTAAPQPDKQKPDKQKPDKEKKPAPNAHNRK